MVEAWSRTGGQVGPVKGLVQVPKKRYKKTGPWEFLSTHEMITLELQSGFNNPKCGLVEQKITGCRTLPSAKAKSKHLASGTMDMEHSWLFSIHLQKVLLDPHFIIFDNWIGYYNFITFFLCFSTATRPRTTFCTTWICRRWKSRQPLQNIGVWFLGIQMIHSVITRENNRYQQISPYQEWYLMVLVK